MGQEGLWYIDGTLRGRKMQGDDIIFPNLDVPDYIGWLVQQKSTKKKMEPQVQFFNFQTPLSLAFLLYWCCMDEILPMSTSKAYNKSHIDLLVAIFKQFYIKNKIPSALIITSDGNLTL